MNKSSYGSAKRDSVLTERTKKDQKKQLKILLDKLDND